MTDDTQSDEDVNQYSTSDNYLHTAEAPSSRSPAIAATTSLPVPVDSLRHTEDTVEFVNGNSESTRRYPIRNRRKPLRFQPEQCFFQPLGPEVTNAELYDKLHARRYGNSSINQPGTSYSISSPRTNLSPSIPSHTLNANRTAGRSCDRDVPQSTRTNTADNIHHCIRSSFALQWNMNGFFNNLADLQYLVRERKPAILALQEIHKASSSWMETSLSGGYKWITMCGQNFYHSVALGITVAIPFSQINLDTELPFVAVRISWPFPVSVVSFYLPNGTSSDLKNQLRHVLEQIPEPIILLGDCNGHHRIWGSKANNSRGMLLADVANEFNINFLNDGSTTFISGQKETTVDVTMTSASITHTLQWSADLDPLGSDHVPITLFLNETSPETSRRPRWLYNQADWSAFQSSVEASLDEATPGSISELTDLIHNAAQSSIPQTSTTPGRRALPWWSKETKNAVKARRKALRAAKRLPAGHPNKHEATKKYREARNTCRQTIREAKENSWISFLDSINNNQSTADLWKRLNAIQGKRRARGISLKIDSCTTRNPEIIADSLADYFAELCSLRRYSSGFLSRIPAPAEAIAKFTIPPDRGQKFNQPFSMNELALVLQQGKGISSGPDDIGYPMVKRLPPSCKAVLLDLINREWTNGTFPSSWTHSLVVPIPKNTGSASETKHYRPIALTSCLSKIMERLANRRLIQHLQENNRLDHRQHAFRSGFGTGTYFAALGQILDEAVGRGDHIEIASLDLSKAYNRAWTPNVLKQLVQWGVTGNMLSFIKNFLNGRSFQVIIGNNRSKSVPEETGVPQGSVIAVTLFLVAMNGVFGVLPKGVYILVYADDIILLVTGRTPKSTRRKLQTAVNAVTKWTDQSGFDISAEKSARLHICSHNHIPPRSPITVKGAPIPNKKTLKILGVLFDRSLSFQQHFVNLRKDCKSRINFLKTISSKRTRSDRISRLRVADAVINSRIFYGIEITCRSFEQLVQNMGPTYNEAIRAISGLLPSTPAIAACIEIGTLPLLHRTAIAAGSRAVSYLERTRGDGSVVFTVREANRILELVAGVKIPPVVGVHWNGSICWHSKLPNIDLKIKQNFRAGCNPSSLRSTFLERISTEYAQHTIRYTDGSKRLDRVGIGIYGECNTESHRLPDKYSIFSAEAAAIYQAVSYPYDGSLLVVTDSASALSALASPVARNPWIQATQSVVAESDNVTFTWVPGHCGVTGNESADHLANLGRTSRLLTRKTPAEDLKKWLKTTVRRAWALEWSQSRDLFIRKVKDETVHWEDVANRRDQIVLSRLRTGHSRVSHSMGGDPEFRRKCTFCNVHNSVEHFLINCPAFDQLRQEYGIGNIRSALQNDRSSETALICFLKEAGLYQDI